MTDHSSLAQRLRAAYQQGPIAPLRDGLAPDDATGAYAVQAINTRYWVEQGRRIVGRKVGLTSLAVQKQFGVNQPDFGVLFEDMQLIDGGVLDRDAMLQPRAEAEVALVLGADVTSLTATPDDIAAAAQHVFAAIEIVDSRIADWQITFADTVADNGSSARFVLGKQAFSLDELDLYTCGMVLEVNGAVASVGAGAACLGHPLNAAAWLARTLAAAGEPLRAGDVVLTGALGPMITLAPGDHIVAKIGGLGEVSFTYGETV
nr:fumarylacetoacetate hydrolase family protein [Pseudomonas sp. P13]